jgi:hypothetical protein
LEAAMSAETAELAEGPFLDVIRAIRMKFLRLGLGLAAVLSLASCKTSGAGKKAEPPAEITIRNTDTLTMQRTLAASFAQQGWEVAGRTEKALRLSQPMTPDDAVRYFGHYTAGSPDADVNYVFTFERRKKDQTFVTARMTGVSPTAYGRVVTVELTDPKARKQLESVLRLLKKEMEKR